jgi:hypothetical protein
MIDENRPITNQAGNEEGNEGVSCHFAAPLGTITSGRLIFASGAANIQIGASGELSELYAAHFEGHIPSVRVQDGIITIQYRRHLLFDGWSSLRQPLAKIALNSFIPWEIEFRAGLSRLTADLSALHLQAVDMGSVSTAELTLPVPTNSANVYLSGSASELILHRPATVALRLQIAGAASQLTLDGQRLGAMGDGIRWQSSNYNEASHRYDIGIAGSVSNLTIDTL